MAPSFTTIRASLFCLSLLALASGHAQPPKGTVTQATLPPGAIYPGTPHIYSVYVPAQYDSAKPTPFMVFLDGSSALRGSVGAPAVLDTLIAEHAIPPMIGIFVDPGILPALTPAVQSRFERSYEYDALNDRYSRFLLEELLPAVAKSYRLSANPDDRGISGVSTGAVCAFMAAWNRPDQFHRVASFIGTYVAMRGADSLPAIVRKTEQKPLRIYLDDGIEDHKVPDEPYGTFYAGSWPINNQVMYEDLQFAGYDAKLVIHDGGHDMNKGAARLTDALRWLWRDYPQPIGPHPPAAMSRPGWDPRGNVNSTVVPNEGWQAVDYKGAASSLAVARDGSILIDDSSATRIAGADDMVYTYDRASRKIAVRRNRRADILATDIDAQDLAITAKGVLYFTDPARHRIGQLDTRSRKPVLYTSVEMASPAGLALSPDQAMLIVTDATARFSWSFQLGPNGEPRNGEPFYRLETLDTGWKSDISGAAEDSIGQIYFATPLGVEICEANGRLAEILNGPNFGGVSTLRFAGPARDWLYVIQQGHVYRRHLRVAGVPIDKPIKPPSPPL